MFKCKRAVLFLLLAIGFIPRGVTAAENQIYANEDTKEGSEDLWESHVSAVYSYFNLKDWSYYNYSSSYGAARSSVVRWGGKFYDPLGFKGGENDTYGNYYLAQYKNRTKSQVLL